MDASAEGHVLVRLALEIEPLGRCDCRRIKVSGHQHCHDLIAVFQPNPAEIHVAAHEPWFRDLHRGDEAQELLDRKIGSAPVLRQPVTQRGIFSKLEDRSADEMRGGLVPRKQEQENHGDHLITAEPRALPLNEDERGDQPIAADLADMLQVLST